MATLEEKNQQYTNLCVKLGDLKWKIIKAEKEVNKIMEEINELERTETESNKQIDEVC